MSMERIVVIAVSHILVSNVCGELVPCFGVDVQAPREAPLGKRFGVDICAHDGLSVAAQTFLASLGIHPPEVVAGMEFRAVFHDPHTGVVGLGFVPDHTDDLHCIG